MYVKHDAWDSAIAGIVTFVSQDKITVMYHPDVANVATRQDIYAEDIARGGYTVRWSEDLSSVSEYTEVPRNDT